jgi:serine protease inhibitor
LVAAYNASGQQLLGKLTGTPNVVASPYSVGTAMAMALAGARGETAVEMTEVLGRSLTSEGIVIANAEVVRSILQTWPRPASIT